MRDDKISESDAIKELSRQKADGEISEKAYKARLRDVRKDDFEHTVSELKSTTDKHFAQIEATIDSVQSAEEKQLLRQKLIKLQLGKKFSPKEKEERAKSYSDCQTKVEGI